MNSVKLENSLAQHQCLFGLIKQCCCKVKEIENYADLKLKAELTKYVSQLVEEGLSDAPLSKNQKLSVDKKLIVIEVLKQVFQLVEEEIKLIEDQIEYNADNKLVKKTSIIGKAFRITKNLLIGRWMG